ncbi:MAG TPA: hypothetical protein VIK68_04435 [Sphingomicrobium sp.]
MSMLLAILVVSGQAQGAQPAAAPPPAAEPRKTEEKKICRSVDAESGSHMSRRICHTAREWQLVDDGVNLSDKTIQTSAPQ